MSQYTAATILTEGYRVIRLTDAASRSIAEIIPEIGNNLYRFDSGGRQVLMPPASLASMTSEAGGSYRSGTPILYPPNRVKNGRFTFGGRTYSLPLNEPRNHLHGEIGCRAWEVVDFGSADDHGAFVTSRFRFADHPDILHYFPHPLTFTVAYRLRNGRLTFEGTIANEGEDEAPFAFGLHPYFSLPFGNGAERMTLTVPAGAEWPVTGEAFVTGLPSATAFSQRLNDGVSIREFEPLSCSLIALAPGERICRIALPDSGYTIAYRIGEQFPFVVLFRPDWSSAYSLEPYTYVTDAFNLPYAPELTGARSLRAGEEVHLTTSMWVETEGGNIHG